MSSTIKRTLTIAVAVLALAFSATPADAASGRVRLYDDGQLAKEWKNPGANLCKSFLVRVPYLMNLTDATVRVYITSNCTGAYWVFPPGDSGPFNTGAPRSFKPLS